MKRITLTLILPLLCTAALLAQQPMQMATNNRNGMTGGRDEYGNQIDPSRQADSLEDSTNTELQSLPPKLFMWRISEELGNQAMVPVDTANYNFQNSNLVEGMEGDYNYLGNLGSPRLNRIFFRRDRDEEAPTLFLQPMSQFYFRPDQLNFTNSNIPYTNLTYFKAGNKVNGEERFKSYFSVNVNKRLALGFNFDYLYGRGYYQNSNTAHFNAGLFGSYIGERYQLHALYNNFYLKMNENGGIADDQYITKPENMSGGKKEYESTTIPVNLEQTSNRNHDFYGYLTHRYRLGFTRLMQQDGTVAPDSLAGDSTLVEEFVPVTSFIHTLKLERARHSFYSQGEEGFFPGEPVLSNQQTADSTTAFSVKNTFGIALLEGFNKYAKAGLTAYLSHKFSKYTLMNTDSATLGGPALSMKEQELFVGGELAKRQGHTLHYNVNGEVGIADKSAGEFRLNADMDLNFRLFNDTVNFFLRGRISNLLPTFYMRHYRSNHYNWNNDFDKELRTRVEAELNIERWRTNLRFGVENLKNYTYFGAEQRPVQYGENIQVMSATLRQNFKLGILHLDNEVTWQKSGNEEVLPLPDLSLYHNLYILTKIAKKVLTVQLGADVRYFSKYKAPAYAPGIQQYHLQNPEQAVEIGGYPIVNAYANLHLKRTRIFVMMYHVNAGISKPNYFLVPHHPLNQRLLKLGVSWNFYD